MGKLVGKSCAKLYFSGGLAAVHSSVKPPQGLLDAVAGRWLREVEAELQVLGEVPARQPEPAHA